jgi:drug/metabolite transporter (DMT)-like permease
MNDVPSTRTATSKRFLGIAVVLTSSLLLSLAPNAAKIAYQEGANTLAVITFRTIVGMLVLAIYLATRNKWTKNSWALLPRSSISGAAQALTTLGFLGAVAFIDVSLAALIFYFHPFVIAVAGHFRGDVKLTPILMLLIGIAIVGIALVLGISFDRLDPLGIALSVLGMASVTVLVFTVSGHSKQIGPIAANFNMTAWASIYFMLIALLGPKVGIVDNMIVPVSIKGWVAVIGAGVTTTFGFVLFFAGAAIIGTTRAAVLGMIEPLLAIALAILLVQEWLTGIQWVGVALVVGSLFFFETAGKTQDA